MSFNTRGQNALQNSFLLAFKDVSTLLLLENQQLPRHSKSLWTLGKNKLWFNFSVYCFVYYNCIFSYGKLCENVSKYRDTKISRWSGIRDEWIKPRTVITQLASEDVFEVEKPPKSQKDDKLIHVGTAVLQLSKLLLLKFVYFLEDHLVEGAFKILYLGVFVKFSNNELIMF